MEAWTWLNFLLKRIYLLVTMDSSLGLADAAVAMEMTQLTSLT
jgi:hypothetical protein